MGNLSSSLTAASFLKLSSSTLELQREAIPLI